MTTFDALGLPIFETTDKIAASGDGLREDMNLIGASARNAITAEGARAEGSAKSYADSKDTSNRAAWAAADATNLTAAKAYTDERDEAYRTVDRALWRAEDDGHQAAAEANAAAYTDGKDTANRAAWAAADTANLTASKAYTDQRDEDYRTVDRALWRSEDDGHQAAAEANAKTYTDAQIASDRSRLAAIESKNTAQDTDIANAQAAAISTANVNSTLAVAKAAGTATTRNIIVNSAPHTDSPAWFISWGTSGAGTRTFTPDTSAPSGIAYLRHTWTTSATSYNVIIRTVSSPATAGKSYAGSIWVRSSIDNVIGSIGYFYDSTGTQLGSKFNRLYNVKAGVWHRLDVNGLVAPAGTVAARLGVGVNSRGVAYAAGATLDVSAAAMVEGGIVPDWFDGSFPNAYWAGAPAASDAVMAVSTQQFAAPFTNAPSYAGPRTGKFSREHRLYIPEGADIGPMRRRIALALSGQISFRLAAIGHSIVAGQGGTPGTIDNPRLLQQRAAQVGKAVTGMVTAVNNTTTDSRVTFDVEWANIGTPRGNMQLHRRCTVAGKSFTYASDTAGNVVDIYTFGNGSAVTYSIDGAAPVTITPTGASAIQQTTVTGLADTKHTVTVTSTTTTAAYLLGISVHNTVGLEIGNFGYSGSVAADWRSDYFTTTQRFYNGYTDAFTNWAADGAIIELGANELIHGFTAADLETNLGNIVSTAQAAGKEIVLTMGTPVEDATRTTWFKDYYPAVYNVADLYKVPVIDLTVHWINRAIAATRGLYYDQWHPNNEGYYDLHSVIARALLP